MLEVRRGTPPLIAALAGAAALAGCMLPWEQVTVRAAGEAHTRSVGSFHGSGLAACIGAALVLLMAADRMLRPRPSQIREAGVAFAGALLIMGAGLFTSSGGYPPASGSGYPPASGSGYEVTLQPGLYAAGIGGVLLVLSVLPAAASRRGGSRSPGSSAAPARR